MSLPNTAKSSIVAITNEYQPNAGTTALNLPVKIALMAQGNSAATFGTDPVQVFSAQQVADILGTGSPGHLAALELFPIYGNGVGSIPVTLYPMDGGSAASAGTITPLADQTEQASYVVTISEISTDSFVLAAGATVADFTAAITAAINAVPEMPVIAADGTTVVNLTAKWQGTTGNEIFVKVTSTNANASTFTIVQPTAGAGEPDIDGPLALLQDNWETIIVHTLGESTTAIDKIETAGLARWGETQKVPFVSYYGSGGSTYATEITVPTAKRGYFCNVKISVPGCKNLSFVIASAAVREIAKTQNDGKKFANDYGELKLTTLTAGARADQWSYSERENLVQNGVSTTYLKDGVVALLDVVTFYHPVGNVIAELSRVVAIHKLMTILYNLKAIFDSDNWKSKPLVTDNSFSTNTEAKRPKDAKTEVNLMLDRLEKSAIVVESKASAKLTIVTINGTNPNRLDIQLFPKVSGSINIIDILNKWSFYFGGN